MIWLYRLLFPVVLAVLSPRYLRTMRRRGGYLRTFVHRIGRVPWVDPKRRGIPRVWIQAVSVGEMLAIEPVVKGLRAAGAEIYLTTTTSTGYRVALDRYAGLALRIAVFPIDWLPFSAAAWSRIDPDLVLLTEGERWPEHVRQAERRGVRVVAINARLSDRSYGRMRRFPAAGRFVVRGLSRVLAASAQDAARFVELGVPAACVAATGNIKLDLTITPLASPALASLRKDLGLPQERLVLLGSSTWEGEEEVLVRTLEEARGRGIPCSLLLVPRHAERRGAVEAMLRRTGLAVHFRSQGPAPRPVDVVVGDTTGELRLLTQVADVVSVGKSLPPHTEGQTPVEAAVLGKPVVFGPGMANFAPLARNLVMRGAAVQVADAAALRAALVDLLGNPERRAALGAAAAVWRSENGGAVERTLAVLREELARL